MSLAATFNDLSTTTAGILRLSDQEPVHAAVAAMQNNLFIVGLDALSILIATVIGYVGVLVMAYGCLRALYDFLLFTGSQEHKLPMVRIHLGKHLALGLEFLVGKDIVESIVHPTWDDLGKLGAIIVLRTVVTIFLSRELQSVEQEIKVEGKELALEKKRLRVRR